MEHSTNQLPVGHFDHQFDTLRTETGERGDDLEKVKDRIIEHLAVRKLRTERGLDATTGERGSGAILLLIGGLDVAFGAALLWLSGVAGGLLAFAGGSGIRSQK